jgi:micrococcal nuclease
VRAVRSLRRRLPWILVLVLAAALVGLRTLPGGASDGAGGSSPATIVRAVDGDTVVARLAGGHQEYVRYIGIDTPEDVKPDTPVQCYALRAAARNRDLVEGRQVLLRYDRERRDRYGRLLAYVYLRRPKVFVNAKLVAEGYAKAYPFVPNTAHAAEFDRLAHRAQRTGRGLWSHC